LEWKQPQEFLFARAMEHDSPKLLFRLACEYLTSVRVIRPGVVNLLERVATARDRARAETWTRVEHLVREPRRRAELDELLVVDPVLGRTRLAWLGVGPTQATPHAVKGELEKLAHLRAWTRAPGICRCCRPNDAGSWILIAASWAENLQKPRASTTARQRRPVSAVFRPAP
jgi:hypothetical protein